jgi:dTDP-glucose 4,6-dehydratase
MNIIGERQDPEKYLPLVINKVLKNEKLLIHADPTKTKAGKRHYLHARNISAALKFILEETNEFINNEDAQSGRFNIVGEKEFDNLEFAQIVAKYVNENKPETNPLNYELVDFHSSRAGHDMRYALDGSKLENYGFKYPVPVDESIKKIVEWTLKEENIKWLKE